MSNIISSGAIEAALIQGDLSKLSQDQRLLYYKNVCESLGLNALTKPFEYIELNRKLVLYATRSCTDQLRKINKVSITIKSRELIGDIYVVTANGKDSSGREDESTGAVSIVGLKGDALANAYLKCETKAKRRVTLSLCGLGMLDETEIETIQDAKQPEAVIEKPKQIEPTKKVSFQDVKPDDDMLSHDPGLYKFTFGKYKGQSLLELDIYDLSNYVQYINKSAAESGKEIKGQVLEAMQYAETYLKSKEFGNNDVMNF
ncbi:hypothetical protein UFOVP610_22 [uncultured Caudovirales phage]|uniref:Uncharacterized protein n=1 Tax=uncultured Caudovirales phage TaxID=2100421 RepID=A0A6J5NAM3_9CAUD|nr:hypothetical protein UFOVP610_22 [uncultured Caudovirales phage]